MLLQFGGMSVSVNKLAHWSHGWGQRSILTWCDRLRPLGLLGHGTDVSGGGVIIATATEGTGATALGWMPVITEAPLGRR